MEEATRFLEQHGGEARLLAGGQSLVPLLNFRLAEPAVLIDINPLEECREVRVEEGELVLGALSSQRTLERSSLLRRECPLMASALPWIGHAAIRNRGTLGGSLVHAHPAAELPALALLLDGRLVLESRRGRRTLAAGEFFAGMMSTALEADEMLVQLRLPRARPGQRHAFLEVARRHGDFALVGAACLLLPRAGDGGRIGEGRIVLFGVGDVPVRVPAAEDLLAGEKGGEEVFRAAAAAVVESVDPISDLHASARYRRHLCGVLVARALERAWAEAGHGGGS